MAVTYEPIATTTLSSNQTTVTFSSIPSTYTDLVLVIYGKTNGTGGVNSVRITFNSDTGNNYSRLALYGVNGSAGINQSTSTNGGSAILGQNSENTGNAIINFQNYSNTTTYKTFIGRENRSQVAVYASIQMWRNTNAINSITLTGDSGVSIVSGSMLTLYGIKAA